MNDAATSVRCMLLPLTSMNLLVPNSAVAEIIGFSAPRRLDGSSEWFSGVALWRGVYVPVIQVEQLCGMGSAQTGPRARIAIVYNPEKDPDLPYVGIHMQDIPRAYLAEQDSILSSGDSGLGEFLLTRVDDEQLNRVIPDLDRIITELKKQYHPSQINELTR